MYETPDGGIRLPRPYTGRKKGFGAQKHFTGSLVHGEDEGQVADVQSHTEMLTALVALARRDVVRLENQVEFNWIDLDGLQHTHFFDFRVTLRDGRRIALVVKWSTEAREPEFKAKTARIASQVTSAFADQVVVVTELDLDPIEVHNAELIHAVRVPEPDVDAAARRAILTCHWTFIQLRPEPVGCLRPSTRFEQSPGARNPHRVQRVGRLRWSGAGRSLRGSFTPDCIAPHSGASDGFQRMIFSLHD